MRDWLDSISILYMYDVLVRAHFFTIDQNSFFVFRFIFDIDQHSIKPYGARWAGWDGVSQVSVICFVSDAVFY